jgi:hypothetical protein
MNLKTSINILKQMLTTLVFLQCTVVNGDFSLITSFWACCFLTEGYFTLLFTRLAPAYPSHVNLNLPSQRGLPKCLSGVENSFTFYLFFLWHSIWSLPFLINRKLNWFVFIDLWKGSSIRLLYAQWGQRSYLFYV